MPKTARKEPNRTATRKPSDPVMETYLRVRRASLNLTTFPEAASIAGYQEVIEASEAAIAAVVDRMRWDGRSWAEIGEALGVTTQAAHRRFSGITGR